MLETEEFKGKTSNKLFFRTCFVQPFHFIFHVLLQLFILYSVGVLDKNKTLERVFSYLDYLSLRTAEEVCIEWKEIIADGNFWEQLYKRNVGLFDSPLFIMYIYAV